ncbi:MAG: C1 family peptidase [Eubacteriales bacterium]|jgi:bleomycin hydrolase|nr:C1 family peptidase [Eubacteriales bacterium]
MKGITTNDIDGYMKAYAADPKSRLLTNALFKANLSDLAFCGEALGRQNFLFSIDIKTMASTNQKSTGRCWLFAATNLLRERIAKEKNLENFELSQSWLAFWDKFERCNYFLESIIATADRDIDDRTVSFILRTGVQDGGQWDMFVNIVNKYGIVPKDAFQETAQSSATGAMNGQINLSLKHNAAALRKMAAAGASADQLRAAKDKMLAPLYTFLVSCYGVPPAAFDFEGSDKDGNYFIERDYTPFSFRETYIGDMLGDYISIINGPTADKPFDKLYTVEFLGNVAEAPPVKYINLEMAEFKHLVLSQLRDGEIVWFGSDCGKAGERSKNLWDTALYEYDALTGLDTSLTKAEELDYLNSAMNHAMVITGVHLDDDLPVRWKIENSWGTADPNGGYFFMSDGWFDDYVYQAVIHKKHLGDKAALADTEPVILKPWDPMGTLAD